MDKKFVQQCKNQRASENQGANKNKGQMQTKKLMPWIYWPTLSNKALSFRCTGPKKQKPFCLLRSITKKQKHLFIPLSWLHHVQSASCTKLNYGQETYMCIVQVILIYLHIQMINTSNTTYVYATKLIRLGNYLEFQSSPCGSNPSKLREVRVAT